jgi:hypothetical protein
VNALYGCRAVHDGPVCLRSDRWSRQAVCSSCTKGIRHGIENGRMTGLSPRGRGLLALTFGTLLSSQGADAHRSKSLDLSRGNSLNVTRLVSRCQTRRLAAPPAPNPLDHGANRGSGGAGGPSRSVGSTGVRGENHVRRAAGAESNPLPALPGP